MRENFLKIASLVSPFFLNITTIIYTPPQNKIKSKFQIKIQIGKKTLHEVEFEFRT